MNHEQRLPYLKAFAYQLSDLTGRGVDDILSTGLYATDFTNNVLVKLEDGSTLNFNHAFFVIDEETDAVGIFTEHCGYYAFHAEQLEVLKQVSRSISIKPVKEKEEKNNSKKLPKAKKEHRETFVFPDIDLTLGKVEKKKKSSKVKNKSKKKS